MIISVSNLKGGVGKSTISRNLAVYFAMQGEKTCIIDTDITQRTTCEWKQRRDDDEYNVDVFPMSTAASLVNDIKTHRQNGYTIIVIDGVPQLEEITSKILLLSDAVLIPVTPSIDDLKSFEKFILRFNDVQTILSGVRDLYGFVVLNKFGGRNNEDREILEAISIFEKQGIIPLKSTIDNRVAHKRSSKYGLTVLEWDDVKAKAEIQNLCEEIEVKIKELVGV